MKTKNKTKIAVALILICILAIVASIILLKKNSKKSSSNAGDNVSQVAISSTSSAASSTATASASSIVSKNTNPLVYENDSYGFQITFNDVWKGYSVKSTDVADSKAKAALSVYLPNSDSSPLTIYVFEKSVWDSIDKNTLRSTKIGENTAYVFTYSTWEGPPTNLATITEKEIANIVNSFKIIQK